jgi:acyl carrier protein
MVGDYMIAENKFPTRERAALEIVNAINRCLTASGRKTKHIPGNECPLTFIPGFDSLCGIEVTVELEEILGVQLEENVFIKTEKGKTRARTLNEVSDVLLTAAR